MDTHIVSYCKTLHTEKQAYLEHFHILLNGFYDIFLQNREGHNDIQMIVEAYYCNYCNYTQLLFAVVS